MTDFEDSWLSLDPLPTDPMAILARWLDEAFAAGGQANPHAIALATGSPDGRPAVRMVLCKAVEAEEGNLVFYTDHQSRKGLALAALPYASACFHFAPQNRQACLSGPVEPTSDEESDAYFASRPVESQVGAWASAQSQPLGSRDELVQRVAAVAARHGVPERGSEPSDRVPRPPNWGGYRLRAQRVELWHSRPGRIHDRAEWQRTLEPAAGPWAAQRLQP
ncbi:MAG: pyridoxamine 5'-phosphate oxidase [Deltaproteobacteria bacterium]|jgi:pyridoxamine 5'-phosphate oxidase|nr:pyridoxamine 5'-phosphate oxidase [Deltaproteobacteria bacterium]